MSVKGVALLQRRSQTAKTELALEAQTGASEQEVSVHASAVQTRVMPEAWKYTRDAGTCHTRHEAFQLWQCREFCSLLHDFPSDCEVLTQAGATCCEFIPNMTASEHRFNVELGLPGEVLTKEAAADRAKRYIAQQLQTHLGFPIVVAVQAEQTAYCAVNDGSLGKQDSVDACEEVAKQEGLEAFAYAREGDCFRVEASAGGSCASGLGTDAYTFYQQEMFTASTTTTTTMLTTDKAVYVGCLGRPSGWVRRHGDVEISEHGAMQCKEHCKNGGHKYFSLECPHDGQEVHCQCSNALGGTGVADYYCEGTGGLSPHQHCLGPYVKSGFRFGDAEVAAAYLTGDASTQHHTRTYSKEPGQCVQRDFNGSEGLRWSSEGFRWLQNDSADVQRDFVGSEEECQARCDELGCPGFIRVSTGQYAGKCYFSGGELAPVSEHSADVRHCFVPTSGPVSGTPADGSDPGGELSDTPVAGAESQGCFEFFTDYAGNDIASSAAEGYSSCQALCQQTAGCLFFTWNNGTCWMKDSDAGRKESCCASSGPRLCQEAPLQERVYGAWVPHHYEEGQDNEWCRTIRGEYNNFEYRWSPGQCGPAWVNCCKRAVFMRDIADKSAWVTLMTSLQAGVNNTAELELSVVSQKSEVADQLQRFTERLRTYEKLTIDGLLYVYGLTSEDEANDECKHVTDACECAFKEGCAWADGRCSERAEGPACTFTEVNGSFQGVVYDNEVFARSDAAEAACAERAGCKGITCLGGQRCVLNKEGTVHAPIDVSTGVLFEVFEGEEVPWGAAVTIQDLKNLSAFKENAPAEIGLFTGEGNWPNTEYWRRGGTRFSGSFVPKSTAIHHFWVSARNSGELWMNGTKLAECTRGRDESSIFDVEQHGQIALTKDVAVKFELLYKGNPGGSGQWWANHIHLYYTVESSDLVVDSYAPKAWNIKAEVGANNWCLDTYGGGGDNAVLGLWDCSSGTSDYANQRFAVSARQVNGETKYIIKTTRGWCFSPEGSEVKVRSCDGAGVPMNLTFDDGSKAKLAIGDKQVCCQSNRHCTVKEKTDTCDSDFSLIHAAEFLAGAAIPVPMSSFRPDVRPVAVAKDCRARLSASCDECERQAGCPTSDLQAALDTWCYENTLYPLARKYLSEWRCYSDAPDAGLDFKVNGLCVDSCGFPELCPGGINGPHEARTAEINSLLLLNEQDPCADPQSHEGQDLDAIYGSLVGSEKAAAHPPILATSLQQYLDDLCMSLLDNDSVARSIKNATTKAREWACVRIGTGGAQQGMCISDCAVDVTCDGSTSTFEELLVSRPRLLLEAAHDGLRHFCKSELGYVPESDVLVTFKLARLEGTELESDPEAAATIEEIITEAFAEKTVVDPQTLSISLGLGIRNCIKFRGTRACDPDGELDAALDQACDEPVLRESSGFCECLHGLRVAKSNCTHDEFFCVEECDRLLGAETQVLTTTRAPKKPMHFRTYQAEDAQLFGPTADSPPPILSGRMYKGYTGSGFVAMEGVSGRAVQWAVSVEEAGEYVLSFRYSYHAGTGWAFRKRMHVKVNGELATDDARHALWATPTRTWSDWQKLPFVTTLRAGSNTVSLVRGTSYNAEHDALGPHVDSLSVATFPGASEWQCLSRRSDMHVRGRLTDDGQVEVMTREGSDRDIEFTDPAACAQSLASPPAGRSSVTCGYDHHNKHGWWRWGFESQNDWCWQFRRRLFAHATMASDLEGTSVRVVMHTLNPTEGFNRMRRVQTMYGDEVLGPAIEEELRALPTIAAFSSGDVVVSDLVARQGTKPTEPRLVRTAVQDGYWNNTGASIHWPCGLSCEEPEGRYVEAWRIGPLPVPGGEFFYGEKHYHHTKSAEKLKWVLQSPLEPTEEWSFHMRVMLENGGNKRGSFLLWSSDGTENAIEFDINSNVASEKLFGKDSGPSRRRTTTVYISGRDFWSPPNFRTSRRLTHKHWHDISILKRDCTITVYVDGVEALANIPQYWKVTAVGLNPQGSHFRIQTFGMTGRNEMEAVSPFCKMYLDKTVGFRVMRKGQSGCLRVTGSRSPVVSTMDMKECTYFYYSTEDSTMRDASTGECLDWYSDKKTYGLHSCHGYGNQRFGPYREVDGKYQFMRFCLGHYDCLDELDFGICPKLQTPCECAEYPKICGWDSAAKVCSSEKKEEGVSCTACDRQPMCAVNQLGKMQELADAWCVTNTKFQYARLLYRDRYLTQRWACFSQTGLPNDRDGMCMDTCGYPVECAAGPMPHDVESQDVHEQMLEEVLWPNMVNTSICSDPYRYSKETCPHLGWGPGKGRSEVCSSARGPLNRAQCGGDKTFGEAEAECRGIGARLCTRTELANDEALLAGCGLERSHVWAKRSDCANGQHLAMPGSAELTHAMPPRCLGPEETAAVVCCADTEKPYVHIHPADLAARAPPTPRTIPEAVWAVYYETGGERRCLSLSRGVLLAVDCGNPSLFASKDGQLHPWEESRASPLRTHLCLEVAGDGESVVAKQCTLGRGSRLTLTDSGKLMVDEAGSTGRKCITFDDEGTRSMNRIVLRAETNCTAWKFSLKQRVATPNVPLAVKQLMEEGGFDDSVNLEVVRASITQAREEVGDQVSEAFWLWMAGVPGLHQSLASTSFPIHAGTVVNLYRLWSYFGEDWADTMTSMALALAYKGRDRNVLDNEMVEGFGTGIHQACGCEPHECPFPIHRGHKPNAAAFMEYYLEGDSAGNTHELYPFSSTVGAPWALMTEWQVVPIEECQFHKNNGYSPGEYTFRYERHEIMCKHSDWHAGSGPRIAEDGGVCGRLSYLSSISHTCSATAPSRGIRQPGHAAGFRYVNTSNSAGYRQAYFWKVYDERVSSADWTLALTENQWGQHSRQGHVHRGVETNTQWHKTIPVSLSMEDGVNRFEKARIAAIVAVQTSYWHDVEASAWMEQALQYDPYNIEVWEWFRVRIEQGKVDGTQISNLWAQFKKVMVEDATVSFHALVERFFFTIVDARACDAERLSWQVRERETIFQFFLGKASGFIDFDLEASRIIFTIKEMECAVVLDGWTKFMEDAVYSKLMRDLMDEVAAGDSVNLERWPYGSGKKGVLAVVEKCFEHEQDESGKNQAVDWVISHVRVGGMSWSLFGGSYFYWMQYERIAPVWDPLVPWLRKTLEKHGKIELLEEFEEWRESCLSQPWKHTHNKPTTGAVYDGCYRGHGGEIQEVHDFFEWFMPFHESDGQIDSCFPDWALEKLRMKGAALMQKGAARNSTDEGNDYNQCLQDIHGGMKQLSELSAFCQDFVKRLVTDDTSGRSKAEVDLYLHTGEVAEASGEDDKEDDGGAREWVAQDLQDLPEWLQNKIKAAGGIAAGIA